MFFYNMTRLPQARHRPRLSSPPSASLKSAVRGSLKSAVRGSLKSAVRGSLKSAVRGSLKSAVHGSLKSAVRGESQPTVRGSLKSAVRGEANPPYMAPSSTPPSTALSSPLSTGKANPPSAALSSPWGKPTRCPRLPQVLPSTGKVSPDSGPPLTQAAGRRQVPVDPVHTSRPGVPYHVPEVMAFFVLLCPQEHLNLSCHVGLVHGDSSASLTWKRLLRDLARALDSLSCPEEASAFKPSPVPRLPVSVADTRGYQENS